MINLLLNSSFGIAFDTGIIFYYVISAIIYISVFIVIIKTIARAIKNAKVHNSIQKSVFDNIEQFRNEMNSNIDPNAPVSCEYCGFSNTAGSKKCSCCGAPIKHKNAK